ncbi:MAG: DUF1552 domain-containing protein [Myxococcus sp.]|nr:DUF1552 domain-containing protein [Myxococcus sp.]
MTLSRRRFLSSLGLGASAPLLLPLAAQLSATAWGQTAATPKNVVFLSMSGGLPDLQLGWPSRRPLGMNDGRRALSFNEWDYHPALAALSPWRAQTVILRNLSLSLGAMQHSGGYGLLAAQGRGDGETAVGNTPVGQTIDQLLADRLGVDSPFRSVVFGVDQDQRKVMHESLFARAAGQPLSHPVRASRLFEALFPAAAANSERLVSDRRVLARVSADVNRLRARLAGAERGQLDGYLESLEAFDKRRSGAACLAPNAPSAERGAVKELPAMLDMAAVALRCGMTHVVGCSVGGGNSHFHFPGLVGPHVGTRFEEQGFVGEHGHDGAEKYSEGRTIAWRWLSTEVAQFLRALEAPGLSGRPVLDDTVVVLFSDSAHDHHNLENSNWRFVVIAGKNVPLRTGGRLESFAWDVGWEPLNPQSRSVASFYCSLARAVGVELPAFAAGGGGARTNGPLAEL